MSKITPFIPYYCFRPNKFIRYYQKRFDDGAGHTATLNIAVYENKHKEIVEAVAQVIWDKV
jgi:hypothetical protein